MNKTYRKPYDRMVWLLKEIASNSIVAWDADFVDDFVEAFPEAEKGLICYLIGPNSSPMLNRAAKLAHNLGYLSACSIGDMDARSYDQRTWARDWTLTEAGKLFVSNLK